MKKLTSLVVAVACAGLTLSAFAASTTTTTTTAATQNPCQARLQRCQQKHPGSAHCEKIANRCEKRIATQN